MGNSRDVIRTYPLIQVHGKTKNWGELIFGARVDNETQLLLDAKSAFAILEFQFEINDTMTRATIECMHELRDYFSQQDGRDGLMFLTVFENMIRVNIFYVKSLIFTN